MSRKKLGAVLPLVMLLVIAAGLYIYGTIPQFNRAVDRAVLSVRTFAAELRLPVKIEAPSGAADYPHAEYPPTDALQAEHQPDMVYGAAAGLVLQPVDGVSASSADGIIAGCFADDGYTFVHNDWTYESPLPLFDRAVLFDDAVLIFSYEPEALLLDRNGGRILWRTDIVPLPEHIARNKLTVTVLGRGRHMETFRLVPPQKQETAQAADNQQRAAAAAVPPDGNQPETLLLERILAADTGAGVSAHDFAEQYIRPPENVRAKIMEFARQYLSPVDPGATTESPAPATGFAVWGGIPFELRHELQQTIIKIDISFDDSYTIQLSGAAEPRVYLGLFDAAGTPMIDNIGYVAADPSLAVPLAAGTCLYAVAGYLSGAGPETLLFEVLPR